jgi:hypothetical protein
MKEILTGLRFERMAAVLAALLFITFSTAVPAVEPPGPAITFDSLTVRGTIYTRVVIVDVAKRHVTFRSAQGFSTVLIEDLDAEAQSRIGRGALNLGNAARTPTPAGVETNRAATPVKAREKSAPDAAEPEETEDANDSATDDEPFHWTMASISGVSVFGLGCLALLVGQIWMIAVAFRVSTGWGIAVICGTFIAGIITSMFCRAHWDVAKHPVCVKAGGLILVVIGWLLWGF